MLIGLSGLSSNSAADCPVKQHEGVYDSDSLLLEWLRGSQSCGHVFMHLSMCQAFLVDNGRQAIFRCIFGAVQNITRDKKDELKEQCNWIISHKILQFTSVTVS